MFWEYWFFNIPNYFFAIVIYSVLARLVLELLMPEGWDSPVTRWLNALTDPFVGTVTQITPLLVPRMWLLPITAFWVMVLRVIFTLVMLANGLTPPIPEN